MKIPCKDIAQAIEATLAKEVQALKEKGITPKLTTFLVGNSSEQLSFVAIKQKVADRLGINFEFVHMKRPPSFQAFATKLKAKARDKETHGIIVQQPLPSRIASDTMYNFIPLKKEIEGHKEKSPFLPPLGLAVLSTLKYVLGYQQATGSLVINPEKDIEFFSKVLKSKTVVLAGRGETGGKPVGKTLSALKVGFLNITSQTTEPERFYQEADIIITGVGKRIIKKDDVKPGVILLNVGLRKEKGKLKGDYDEEEIEEIAEYYSPTPGGIGPIDVLYLYKNLIDAVKLQTQ
jgi:methylenetetrahydrofolate dehydrogenase (NADP+)/methenyltetrahydrofolate cyclohydrolase